MDTLSCNGIALGFAFTAYWMGVLAQSLSKRYERKIRRYRDMAYERKRIGQDLFAAKQSDKETVGTAVMPNRLQVYEEWAFKELVAMTKRDIKGLLSLSWIGLREPVPGVFIEISGKRYTYEQIQALIRHALRTDAKVMKEFYKKQLAETTVIPDTDEPRRD